MLMEIMYLENVHFILQSGTLRQPQQTLKIDTLRSFDRQTQSSVPDQLSQRSQSPTHTECCSIVQCLMEAIVVEENTGR